MSGQPKEFGLTNIGQISVTAYDLERAVAFYRDRLGMELLFAAEKMAFFDCGGVRLMLAVPEGKEFEHPASIIYYRVENIGEAHKVLSGRGVAFAGEPQLIHKTDHYELWMAFFHDSEGNVAALMEEVTPEAA